MSFDWIAPVIGAVAGGILTPLLIKFIMASDEQAESKDGFRVGKFTGKSKIAVWICVLFFFALASLAFVFPGKSGAAVIIFVLLFFGSLGLFSLLIALSMNLADVIWSEETISGVDFICRRKTFKWDDITRVEYVAWAQCIKVTASDDGVIWVSPMMAGYDEIVDRLDQACSRNGVRIPKLKDNESFFH